MLAGFRGESAFSSWLHRIAVNVVLVDVRTRVRLRARVELSDDLEDFGEGSSHCPPEAMIDLETAIALLPAKARAILVLHDLEGYQHEEIAIMLDIAPGTSKSQLHRAHKLLKERLGS
jgi:RNA polymerase sigma-70 factor (ECF subfamily)